MISDLDLSRRIQCSVCHQIDFLCQCQGHKDTGREFQFILEEEDLPNRAIASIEEEIEFWSKLVRVGRATRQFDISNTLELFDKDGLYDLMRKRSVVDQFYEFWRAYSEHDHFRTVLPNAFPAFSSDELNLVGKQSLDSFFSGRWYELCPVSIGLIMNSLQLCGPDPNAKESTELRKIAMALTLISAVLDAVSTNRGFSLVEAQRLSSMRSLVVYKVQETDEGPPPLVEEEK